MIDDEAIEDEVTSGTEERKVADEGVRPEEPEAARAESRNSDDSEEEPHVPQTRTRGSTEGDDGVEDDDDLIEESGTPHQNVDVRHVRARGNVQVTTGDIVNQAFAEESRLARIERETVDRVDETFVEPPDLKRHSRDGYFSMKSSHIFVMEGEKGSGRLTAAIYLASRLVESEEWKEAIWRCSKKATDDDLLSLVSRAEDKQAAVLILEDAFDVGVQPDELLDPLATTLSEKLRSANNGGGCFLILTSSPSKLPSKGMVQLVQVRKVPLAQVLRKALASSIWTLADRYTEELCGHELWKRLGGILQKPAHPHRLVDALQDLDQVPDDDDERKNLWVRLAKEAANPGDASMRRWFDGLSLEERLLGLLTVFFEGATLAQILVLFSWVLRHMSKEGIEGLKDPATVQIGPSLRRLHLRMIAGSLDWEESIYPSYLLGSPVSHHQPLLLDVAEALLGEMKVLLSFDSTALRKGMGVLLGNLAQLYPERIQADLDKLAKGNWKYGTIVSYAMRFLVGGQGDEFENEVESDHEATVAGKTDRALSLMYRWARSTYHRQRWTAAAAAWQSYEVLLRSKGTSTRKSVSRLLFKAAQEPNGPWLAPKDGTGQKRSTEESQDNFYAWLWEARSSISYALARILARDPDPVIVDQIKWWFACDPKSDYPQVALRGAKQFCEEIRHLSIRNFLKVYRLFDAMLGLEIPTSARARRYLLPLFGDIFKHVARRWMQREESRRLTVLLCRDLTTRLPLAKRRRWVEHTTLYWTHGFEAELAARIRSRAAAMEGLLIYPPPKRWALLVIDTGLLVKLVEPDDQEKKGKHRLEPDLEAIHLVRRMAGFLGIRWYLEIAALGRPDVCSSIEGFLDLECRLLGHGLRLHPHRLVTPILDKVSWSPEVTVVVTRGLVDDLADMQANVAHLVVVQCGEREEVRAIEGLGIEHIVFPEISDPASWSTWTDHIDAYGSRYLSGAEPSRWTPFLDGFGLPNGGEPIEVWEGLWMLGEPLERWIESRATETTETPSGETDPQDDLVSRSCGAVGWLASRSLSACVDGLAAVLQEARLEMDGAEPPTLDEPSGLRPWIALAGARFLLRLFRNTALTADRPELTKLFDPLAFVISEADPVDGPTTVLQTVEHWLEEPGWTSYLASDIQEGRGRLLRWTERYSPNCLEVLREKLPESYPIDAHGLWGQIRFLAEGGRRLRIPDLIPGKRYGVLVMTRSNLPKIRNQVERLLRELQSRNAVEPIVFELGRTAPIWVQEQTVQEQPITLDLTRYDYVPLLGPLLDQHPLSPKNVAYVLIVGPGLILDAAELADSAWWNQIARYQGPHPSSDDSLRWLASEPRTRSREWEMLAQALIETEDRTAAPVWRRRMEG